MLDKRQRLTEHQVVHGILSVLVSAAARDEAPASSRVQGLAAKHSAGTRHVSAGRAPGRRGGGTRRFDGSLPLPRHKKHADRSGAEHQVIGKYGRTSKRR
jgi:hypothetical protein